MYVSKIILACLLSVTSVISAPLFARDAATVQADLQVIKTNVATLDAKVIAFTGNILDALSFLAAYNTLLTSVRTATTDTIASAVFTSAESAAIGTAGDEITASVSLALTHVIEKQTVIAATGLSSAIVTSLQNLKTAADALFDALEDKVDSAYLDDVQAARATINAAAATAIDIFD